MQLHKMFLQCWVNKSKLKNLMYSMILFFCIQTCICAKPKRTTSLVTKLIVNSGYPGGGGEGI